MHAVPPPSDSFTYQEESGSAADEDYKDYGVSMKLTTTSAATTTTAALFLLFSILMRSGSGSVRSGNGNQLRD
jgi:hypothetical protein